MKDEHKHCWNCEDEERCCPWPPECVCERWWPELDFNNRKGDSEAHE